MIDAALVVVRMLAAHLVLPLGLVPFVEDGRLVGGATTWGIVVDDGGGYARACEEAMEQIPTSFAYTSDGRVLVGTLHGLLVTADGGCTYAATPGPLEGRGIEALAVALERPSEIVAVVEDGDGHGIFVSDDAGRSFGESTLMNDDDDLRTAVVSANGERIAVGALSRGDYQPGIIVSLDRGITWAPPIRIESAVFVAPLGFDIDGRIMLAVDGDDGGYKLSSMGDAGDLRDVATFEVPVRSFATFGGARFVTSGFAVMRQPDVDAPFAAISDIDGICVTRVTGDDHLWLCGRGYDEGFFLRSDDGVTFVPEMAESEISARECPAASAGSLICGAYPAGASATDGVGNPPVIDISDVADASGCGCRSAVADGGPGLAWLLVLIGMRRRRCTRMA